MSEAAFDRFTCHPGTAGNLQHTDGPYVATVQTIGGSLGPWSYVVFHLGRAIDGAFARDLDVYGACEMALSVIDAHKKGTIR